MPYFRISCVGPSDYIVKRIENLILSCIVHVRCHNPKSVSEGTLQDQPWKVTRIPREGSIEALFLEHDQLWCMFIHIDFLYFHDSSVEAHTAPSSGIRLPQHPEAFSAGLSAACGGGDSGRGRSGSVCESSRPRDLIVTFKLPRILCRYTTVQ